MRGHTYYLARFPYRRVVLTHEKPRKKANLIEIIPASSWLKAREQIQMLRFDPKPGHGWIEPEDSL